ncbi:MAG: hypothetical protein WA885_13260 [Phormidesmis sp.]
MRAMVNEASSAMGRARFFDGLFCDRITIQPSQQRIMSCRISTKDS